MNEMKGYVDSKVLESEKKWITREYGVLFNGWADCMAIEVTTEGVNQCQHRAFANIRKARAHFLLFKGMIYF